MAKPGSFEDQLNKALTEHLNQESKSLSQALRDFYEQDFDVVFEPEKQPQEPLRLAYLEASNIVLLETVGEILDSKESRDRLREAIVREFSRLIDQDS